MLKLALLLLTAANTPPTEAAPPAAAVQSQSPAATKPNATPAQKPKLVCRTIELVGSRTGGKKICMTREQWKKQDL